MEKQEARQLVRQRLDALRDVPYEGLLARYFNRPEHEEVDTPSGVRYDLTIEAFWDDRYEQNLRVRVCIYDRASRGITILPFEDFIISPNGVVVGDSELPKPLPQARPSGPVEHGTVAFWHGDEGWGAITAPLRSGVGFAHFSHIRGTEGYRELAQGDEVEFVWMDDFEQDGCQWRVTWVRAVTNHE